jgi:hypothetical protein
MKSTSVIRTQRPYLEATGLLLVVNYQTKQHTFHTCVEKIKVIKATLHLKLRQTESVPT